MACKLIPKRAYWVAFIYTVLVSHACNGFYLSENYMHTYSTGEEIYAKVNSLTSIYTVLPFSYYSLPYCKPHMGIKESAENLGQLLMGDQILNSPDRFRLNVNESVFLCTTSPLSEHEVKLLKQRTRDLYQVNMILDNLPAMRFAQQNGIKIQWTGFPVGYALPNSNEDYIIDHLKFRVLVHEYEGAGVLIIGTGEEGMGVIPEVEKKQPSGYEIAGFEVVLCRVKYDPKVMSKFHMYEYDNISVNCSSELDKSQIIREQERVSITYDVEVVKSDIRWPSRWDAYLRMEGAQVHWFSILNSLMVIIFLAGIVFVICLRTVRGDLTMYEELDKKAQVQMNEQLSSWRFVVSNVFYQLLEELPHTLLVGFLGTQAEPIQYPTRTSEIPREIHARKYLSWLLVLGAGTLSFGTIFIELFFILSSIWLRRFYYVFRFLLVVFLLLVIVCTEVSVVLTYMHLCAEDWQWWWKAFYASGSVALYVFLNSINYLFFDLKGLNGPALAIL
ncbi:Transmembrane 9 superfamily member 12 [Camellia lanceoleosa]|nr:Transmembrane 9 superfamily member 12 [Camellia lanceoleosa]